VRVNLVSLGCAKNLVDGETMLGLLCSQGHELAGSPELADVVLVNTCGFVLPAQKESVDTILEFAALKRDGLLRYLVVTGCLAQRSADELVAEIPEIDAILGTGSIEQVGAAFEALEALDRRVGGLDREALRFVGEAGHVPAGVLPRVQTTPPWTAYLKISEGCDNRCRYCVIPALRGPHRSRSAADLLDEVRGLTATGTKEIVLIGQDLTRWGQDLAGGPASLASLLADLSELPGVEWLRLQYLHPARVGSELLQAMAQLPKVCKYLDLPVQHGDDAVLAAMGRETTAAELLDTVALARRLMPEVAIRTSFIVGFPGETSTAFAAAMSFLRRLAPDWTAVFAYSRETGTPAATMTPQVPARSKIRRRAEMLSLARRLSRRRNRDFVGRKLRVLVETGVHLVDWAGGRQLPAVSGRSERDAPGVDGQVHIAVPEGAAPPEPGTFLLVEITAAGAYDLYGRPASAQPSA